ncbi:MarR family transcriptional regulator [Fodinicola feengrottensis]|uniref:HTH marR-type domain-containing protein n=1 Tax=Fodinicola feengrottensis TaxID=435914 RepID=A0ABN2HEB5_9ACTN|nr:MarR family transcriptional regulator [Fodinicola feengrottensis]
MRASDLHRIARQLREIALVATGNTAADKVTMGELLVVEDVAAHPGSSIREITERTDLAQSLVSRIVAAMHSHGVFTREVAPDDARKTLVSIDPVVRAELFKERGNRPVEGALAESLPGLLSAEIARTVAILDELTDLLQRGSR